MKNFLPALFCLLSFNLFSQPSSEALVAWYPFNNSAVDESQNDHNGGVFGAVLTEDRFGHPNSAYYFDGIDDYILVPDHPDLRLGQTDYTISLWIKAAAFKDLQSHALLSKRAGQGNQGYLIQLIGEQHVMNLEEGTINIITSGGWNDPLLTTQNKLTVENWHHLLYCFDQSSGKGQFFIDAQPDVEGSMVPANPNTSNPLYIGKDKLTDGIEYPTIAPGYFGGFHFFGALDDIRIYRRKLNLYELTELFKEGLTNINETSKPITIKIFPDPVLKWLEVEVENATVKHYSITDNNGKLISKAVFSNKIDCAFLPSGMYFLTLYDANNKVIKTEKFTKTQA